MCDICGGTRTISLDVRRSIPLASGEPAWLAFTGTRRSYPCPECSSHAVEHLRNLVADLTNKIVAAQQAQASAEHTASMASAAMNEEKRLADKARARAKAANAALALCRRDLALK